MPSKKSHSSAPLMKKRLQMLHMSRGKWVVLMAPVLAAGQALATTEFEIGDGWQGNWTTSLSYSKAVRTSRPNSNLYTAANGALVGYSGGSGAPLSTVDEGNLNYRKGDTFSEIVKVISEVEVKKNKAGGFFRVKAWYDYALQNNGVALGSQGNGYNGYNSATNTLGESRPLSDANLDPLVKFKGLELMDAYIYDEYEGINSNPLQVRLGKQVLNWGESIFVQGVNRINPVDVPALRRPGTELKEAFIPVWAASVSQSLGNLGTVEGFYQFKYRSTPINSGCGNYWSETMGAVTSSAPGGCDAVVPLGGLLAAAGGSFGSPGGVLNPALLGGMVPANSAYLYQIESPKKPKDGDFGLAYRFSVDAIDTEFGLYAERLAPRTPVISTVYTPNNPNSVLSTLNALLGAPVFSSAAAYWEYPAHEKVFGISASTNVLGWSVSGELSQVRDYAAQINGSDVLNAALTHSGPYGATAAELQAGNPAASVPGYTLTNKNQLQMNFLKLGNGVLGASQYTFVGEVAGQRNDLPDHREEGALRYGRAFIFGTGSTATTNTCAAGANHNPSAAGCQNDGYVTRNAWGYRLMGRLEYPNVWDTGVTAYPSIFFSHDVKGYSVDGQFVQDRKAINLGLRLSYQKDYNLDLNYVTFGRDAKYDPLRDRDFFSATLSVMF